MKVLYVLDPGHYKNYNVGYDKNYYEGNAMFKLALYQAKYLKEYNIDIKITRDDQSNPTLLERGLMAAKEAGYDTIIFESLHSNAPGEDGDSSKIAGALIISSIKTNKSDGFLDGLLATIASEMYKITKVTYPRGIITKTNMIGTADYYGVLRSSTSKSTVKYSFITEHGFHSNPKECAYLNDDKNLENLAKAKANYIAKFLKLDIVNNNYITLVDKKLRTGPGSNFPFVKWEDMTESAKNKNPRKKHGCGYYSKGTEFTALEIIQKTKVIWAKTPSGWICIKGMYGYNCSKK